MATHSSILAWEIPRTEEPDRLWSMLSSQLSMNTVSLIAQLCLFGTTAHHASLSITIPQSLLKVMSVELVMPSNHFVLCCPHLLLPSSFPSIRVFSNELALCMKWPKYWGFSFCFSPSNEYSGLISFRIVWFDPRTLKSLLQHHTSKASILGTQPSLWSNSHIHT